MNKLNPRSLIGDAKKIRHLRQSLGWTQDDVATRSGYSARLIRKIESGAGVRPATLLDVLQCYHEASEIKEWTMSDFLLVKEPAARLDSHEPSDTQRPKMSPPEQTIPTKMP